MERPSGRTPHTTTTAAAADEPAPPAVPRWIAATLCCLYGFAKLNGSQFTILDSELTRPLGEVSGFWLTWYYFGYSPVYGSLLALLQIGAAVLLVLPRTALAGALMLLPVVTNILLIDVLYGVDPGGTAAALVLFVCTLLVVAPYVKRIANVVLIRSQPIRPGPFALIALPALLVVSFGFTWWVANYNNRRPTPIDGIWKVTAQTGTPTDAPQWQHVFFERNRAFLAVFRAERTPDERRHFEIGQDGTIEIWERWLTKGRPIMRGRSQGDDRIELQIFPELGGGRLILHRKR
jgi:hypothetical protein